MREKTMEIDVRGPRPLAQVAVLLERRFGRTVTYEDAPYCHQDDMIRDREGRIIPRGGRIVVQYQQGHGLREAIKTALEAHASSGFPGVFAVERYGATYHIVPRAFRNSAGAMEKRIPLLDTAILLPSQTRSGLQLVEGIALGLAVATGESVGLGTLPTNALVQHVSTGNVSSEKARHLLLNMFRQMGRVLSWQLLNHPGTAEFFLNVHPVPEGREDVATFTDGED